jgi:hypothetical protein
LKKAALNYLIQDGIGLIVANIPIMVGSVCRIIRRTADEEENRMRLEKERALPTHRRTMTTTLTNTAMTTIEFAIDLGQDQNPKSICASKELISDDRPMGKYIGSTSIHEEL